MPEIVSPRPPGGKSPRKSPRGTYEDWIVKTPRSSRRRVGASSGGGPSGGGGSPSGGDGSRSRTSLHPNKPLMGQGLEDVTDAAVFKALLREALHRRVALVVDVFKDFDKGDGNIDKKGFKKALRRLGLSEATPRKLVNALWGSWDADCSGSLGIAELRKVLRSERKGGDGIMSDDAAALLESRAREAKRQALKDQAAARRAMIQAAERNAQANKQQMEALNRVESLYRDLGVLVRVRVRARARVRVRV